MPKHIEPTAKSGEDFYQSYAGKGKIVMLNLLRFKEIANYTGLEPIKPQTEISGKEAYSLYMKETLPLLKEAGGKLLFFGESDAYLIGPQDEKWDMVLLVEHQSVDKFMKFARNPSYNASAGHRTAALADSRLLPISGGMTR